ncbi:MAG: helix-turn-helix transcriptional regulator [Candidatus ainarchaeum sp.]|nr:helix-turn-helix transcriptional regulator [Candidatus ainarchaeum sp.]
MLKNHLKLYRVQAELSQEQLASILGVRRETIHFLEKGKHVPSLELALKISRFFKVTIEDIFYFED